MEINVMISSFCFNPEEGKHCEKFPGAISLEVFFNVTGSIHRPYAICDTPSCLSTSKNKIKEKKLEQIPKEK